MSDMLKSSGAVGAATLASRVLGLVREIAFARLMGDSWVASAYIMAFTIPNLFRGFLGEGALTAAFIPVFKEKEKLKGDGEMWRAANAVLSALALVAGAIVVGAILLITGVLRSKIRDAHMLLVLQLLRLMFPYLLLVCVAVLFIGILNARGHFFVPALGTTLLNVIMIASTFFLAPLMGKRLEEQVFGLAIGVLAAGAAQMLFQLPRLKRDGFRYQWVSPWSNETVRRVAMQMAPAVLGAAAYKINVLVVQSFAFWTGNEIVASFNYAVRLTEFPQGLFGISLAAYLLPALSGLAAEKKHPEFRATLRQGIGYVVFIHLLGSVLLFTLATPIVRMLFERGEFDADATARAASALMCLAPGLVAVSIASLLSTAFYAMGDTRTPMRVTVLSLAVNLVLSVALVGRYHQAGLALANTLTGFLDVGLLMFALRKNPGGIEWGAMLTQLKTMLPAGLVAAGVAWTLCMSWTEQFGHESFQTRVGEVFVPMAAASAVYLGLGLWLRVPFVKDLVALVRIRIGRGWAG